MIPFVAPATGLASVAWLMIAIPLVVAAILLLVGKAGDGWAHLLGVLAPIASGVIAVILFIQMLGAPEGSRAVRNQVFTWIATGSWRFDLALQLDQLSILFALLVTIIGSLIFIYSIGYMAHDPRRRRFFAYMNIFVAAMLLLVLSDNYLLLFIGWEGVGLASYLLIGFWQERTSAALAAKKAFLVNRIGDLGLFAAMFIMLAWIGSTAFSDVNARVGQMPHGWVVALGCLLLLAACGKSAQVPLQSWLLDAMEGPTPVSALIHAATMVTAGVYLVVRSQAIFGLTPEASLAVAIVGVVTLWVGAWIGSAKDDIKKVLAGSTMSQIGYMMLAAGIGPAGAAFAIFHLLTHGAFKANMFLGAGSVMHATQDDTDMRHFGALRKVMPYTFWTFACGYLAIIGFPFLSGFYSKDHIITAAFERNVVFGVLALAGAGITAFYMTRLVMMTFFGSSRWVDGVQPHESPAVMTVPLIVLAVLSVGLGAALNGWIQQWLAPATGAQVVETSLTEFSTISIATLVVVALGVGLGWWLYRGEIAPVAEPTNNFFVNAGRNELYANQVNEAVFMTPGQGLVSSVALTDDKVVDGAIRGDSWLATAAANGLRLIQNGYVRTYGLTMLIGVVVIGVVLMLGRLA